MFILAIRLTSERHFWRASTPGWRMSPPTSWGRCDLRTKARMLLAFCLNYFRCFPSQVPPLFGIDAKGEISYKLSCELGKKLDQCGLLLIWKFYEIKKRFWLINHIDNRSRS